MASKTIGSGTTYSAGYTITTGDGSGFGLTNLGVVGSTSDVFGLFAGTANDFVYNSGKILASTASGDGIFANQKIRITNKSGGLISANYGIALSGGGTIVNASGGSITGRDPIYATTTSVYVENLGRITGSGTSSSNAGVVLNAGGYVYNKPGGLISGANGVLENVSSKVRNEGTIKGNSADGVDLTAGGTVTSETQTPNSAATISGGYAGIVISGASGYVLIGSGQISGGVAGVFLLAGGYIHEIGGTGGGTISANYAVAINNGTGTVETGGIIAGGQLGVGMDGAGPHKVSLADLTATISGSKAISISGGNGYIYDRGTINGGASGTAVIMASGYNNLLEVYGGAKIIGAVNGGNFQHGPHTTTLLFAQGLGTLTGFGSRYYNIGNVTVKSGASWTMDSTDTFSDPSLVSSGSTSFFPVTLVDDGTLNFGGTELARLTLGSQASLTVAKGGVVTPAYLSQAIYAPTGASAPVVVNYGHVTAAGNEAVRLDSGGSVTNQSGGVLSANDTGVRIQNAKGTVTNSGLITSALSYGIALGAGGAVINTGGTISGTLGVGIYGGAGTVTNTGRIAASGNADGVVLKAGGTVINQAGTIVGFGGVYISGGAGTVTNYGQISGNIIYSVNLPSGFANRLRIAPGASFSGNGVEGGNTAGATAVSTIELLSAASAGTFNSMVYQDFTDITVDSGAKWTIGPSGSIAAYQTLVDSGTVINEVVVASEVTLTNGTFVNTSGYLDGNVGVIGLSGTNVVVNNSNIRATGIGVNLGTAGAVTNQSDGFIGGKLGVYIEGPAASVVNQGLIEGYLAVYLAKGGSVVNQSGGLISGRVGVVINAGNGTVTNAGTIVSVGDYGVILPDHGVNRLVLDPGSTIAGLVHGGLAGTGTSFSTLELAPGSSAGTIGGIGSKYIDFSLVSIDAGAAWTLTAGQTIAANQALYVNGTLTSSAVVLTPVQLGAGATLTNASGGTITVDLPVILGSHQASPATVVNYGLIHGSGGFYGVELLSGGSVTNRGGTIEGSIGIVIAGAGTVTNTGGAIIGSSGTAVSLEQGYQNRVAFSPGAVFSGKVDGGNPTASGTAVSTLELMSGSGAGTLSGIGSQYVHFQNFLVDPGATWTIAAGQQLPAAYTVTDNGTLQNNATLLTGVTLGAGAVLVNGTVVVEEAGVSSSSVMISSASDGAVAQGAGALVLNHGILQGGSFGVSLVGPSASIYNAFSGTISGGVFGATISGGPGTVMNYGEVVGALVGVVLSGGGKVTNFGAIAGLLFGGVSISGGFGTVANYGTIAGNGTAVSLAAGFQNLVKVGPDAMFQGTVNGGNTIGASQVSTLELTRYYETGLGNFVGTVSGLGGRYINFAQITVDAGASWVVTGNPTLGAGITLSNSGALAISDGGLNVAGTVYNNGLIQENAGTVTAGRLLGTGEVLIGAGSTLLASGLVGPGQTVDFAGAGLLALTPASFSGQIDGLRAGGTIELAGITDATTAGIVNGNTLAIQQSGGPTLDLTLDPTQSYAGVVFPVATLHGEQFVSVSGQTGPTVISGGEDVQVTGAGGSTLAAVDGGSGGIVVTGASSLLAVAGEFTVGDSSLGNVAINAGGAVDGPEMIIANTSSASGSSVNVSGAASELDVYGSLVVGEAGFGSLSLSQGATVTAASAIEAAASGGDGVISVAGTGSKLTLTGSLTVGSQAAGEVSILGGGTVSALDVTVGNSSTLSSGNVDVEGAGELLIPTGGILNVGVAGGGSGVLTIGTGAILNFAGTVVEAGKASFNNNGGTIDPDAVEFTSASNGGTGLNEYNLYVGNIGAVQVASGTGTWDTPMVLTGTSADDAANNINNGDVGEWQLSQSGTLLINTNTVDAGQAIVFEDATDTLIIGQVVDGGGAGTSNVTPTIAAGAENVLQSGGFAAEIWGYVAGDQIEFNNLIVTSDSIVGGNTLDLFNGGSLLGSLTFFNKAGTRPESTAGMDAAAAQISCYAAGTLIETVDGPCRVEMLRVGDEVVTVLGGPGEIVWVGSRTVDCARHPRPESVWPVRIAKHAFGRNLPARDLYLSPDHAVFVNGVLVPAKLLINGTTIRQVRRRRVVYHHIELARHDVVMAEGLPAETYLDTGDRSDFHHDDTTIRLHPHFGARLDTATLWEAKGAAPLVMAGERLDAVRRGHMKSA